MQQLDEEAQMAAALERTRKEEAAIKELPFHGEEHRVREGADAFEVHPVHSIAEERSALKAEKLRIQQLSDDKDLRKTKRERDGHATGQRPCW